VKLSINNGTFRVVLGPPIAREIVSMCGHTLLGSWQDRREFILYLDSIMPWWRESLVLVEELFDREKDLWLDCTWQYNTAKEIPK
jgi:hypothetical protein